MSASDRQAYIDFRNYVVKQTQKLDELQKLHCELNENVAHSQQFLKELREMYEEAQTVPVINTLESNNASDDIARHDEISKFLEAGPPKILLSRLEDLYDLEVDVDQTLAILKVTLEKLKMMEKPAPILPACKGDVNFSGDLEKTKTSLDQLVMRLKNLKNIKSAGNSYKYKLEMETKLQHFCHDVEQFSKMIEAKSKMAQCTDENSNEKALEGDTTFQYNEVVQKLLDTINNLIFMREKKNFD